MSTVAKKIVIACQGGGSHAAYVAGALKRWLPQFENSEDHDRLLLHGFSGTSGGALCALLAWYGHLQGGADMACRKLDAFWESNCARTTGERLWNDSTLAAIEALPYEITFSPYVWPLRQGLDALTWTWPMVADALGPFNAWGRGDYFQLGALIERQVDFKLVEAVGALLGIEADIGRWHEADLQCNLTPPLDPAGNEQLKQQLAKRIRSNARDQPLAISQLMEGAGFGAASPLKKLMADWPADGPKDLEPFGEIADAVRKVREGIPRLLIGAVDVGSGEFVAFDSERAPTDGGISLASVMASAALPWISEAVSVDYVAPDGTKKSRSFWDGLFSQNPPIKNFLAGVESDRIPNEIWVLQINPRDFDVPLLARGIADRRNALSGNLSLHQEISFIEAVNKRVTRNGGDEHQLVQVHRVILDRAAVEKTTKMELNALSKSDRSPVLKDALVAHGEMQGERFLSVRRAAQFACDQLDGRTPGQAPGDDKKAKTLEAIAVLRTLNEPSDGTGVRLHIDEFILPSGIGEHAAPLATARWHTRGILNGTGAGVQVEGESDFEVAGASGEIELSAVRITEVKVEKKEKKTRLAEPAQRSKGRGGAPRHP